MAVVKVKSVKTGLAKTIRYVINPDKTRDGRLTSSNYEQSMDPDVLARAMTDDLEVTCYGIRQGTVLGRHVIQSFDPEDDITPEQAHRIGVAFVEEITQGQHKYVIATHTDRLCRENGLSVIRKPKVERHGRSLEEIYSGVRGSRTKVHRTTARKCPPWDSNPQPTT